MIGVAVFLAAAGTAQVQLAKLAPLIAQLRPTDEHITSADRRRHVSFRAVLAVVLLSEVSALASAFGLGLHIADPALAGASTMPIVLNLVISLGIVALFATIAVRVARERDRQDRGKRPRPRRG